MTKVQREILKLIRSCHLEPVDLRQTGSNHLRAVVRAADGRERFYIFANSTGDHRSMKNAASNLRRFAAGQLA